MSARPLVGQAIGRAQVPLRARPELPVDRAAIERVLAQQRMQDPPRLGLNMVGRSVRISSISALPERSAP